MRTAQNCPICATYIDASCITYNGPSLSNIDSNPGDALDGILININTNLAPVVGTVAPTQNALYVGQLYVNIATNTIYYAHATGTGAADWIAILDSGDFPTTVNIQSVLTAGSVATNRTMTMNGNAGYQIYLNASGSNSYIQLTGKYGTDVVVSTIGDSGVSIENNTTNLSVEILPNNTTMYSDGANTLEISADSANYANNSLTYPSGTGTFAISVNGIAADSTGDVDLGGYTGNIIVGGQTLTFTNGILTSVV